MLRLNLIPLFLLSLSAAAQNLKDIKPEKGPLIDRSVQGEALWNKQQQGCAVLFKKAADIGGYERLSTADRKRYDQCSENEMKGYWDAVGDGCSWYCGGGPDSVYASSSLKPMSGISYKAENAHDLSYKTAWVEGAPGPGIGEYLVYRFSAQAPRITKIIVVNGYVKSEKAWRENARVKKLKMYLNNKPFAILDLEDNRNEQIFQFDPIGNSDRDDWEALAAKPAWTLKFEILEVYKGEKFEETAISEIYFDGIDVHCFGAGTLVRMADQTEKPIEEIRKGDLVLSYDFAARKLVPVLVSGRMEKKHKSLVKLVLEDREVICTPDHPFFTMENQWASVNPVRSNSFYLHKAPIQQLLAGESIFLPAENRFVRLLRVDMTRGPQNMFTLQVAGGNNFIANGMLVKTEESLY